MNRPADLTGLLLALVLPTLLGWLLRRVRLFKDHEIPALRKFAMKVCVPFLIFTNLYRADVASLMQAAPLVGAFTVLAALYGLAAWGTARLVARDTRLRLTVAYSIFAGNYVFLGWSVIGSFFGPVALVRGVFFSMFFWPVILVSGFFLRHLLAGPGESGSRKSFLAILGRDAGLPLAVTATALALNLVQVRLPVVLNEFAGRFAAMAIPLILFVIGQNLRLRFPADKLRLIAAASAVRLLAGVVLGLVAVWVVRLLFPVDPLSRRVILLQSVMPTATMATFFAEHAPLDEELLSSIIAASTLLSFLTLPLWATVIRHLVP
jgi:predicted permease